MSARHAAGVVIAYAAMTLVMTHPMINLSALASSCYPGDARLMIWTLAWDNHAVLAHAPLFSANIFYPAADALKYNEHLFGLSLFTLPIYALTRNPILAYNLIWLISFPLRALAMHALVWRYTRQAAAALVAGSIYAFSFYNMLHAPGHLSLIWTWLIPMALLLFERWLDRPTIARALLWGAALVLQALATWYLAVIALLAMAIVGAWRIGADVRDQFGRRALHLCALAVIGAAVLWPFARYYTNIETPSAAEVRKLSADWASYLVPPLNTLSGQWWLAHISAAPRWIWGEQTLFLGWIATGLAAAGLIAVAARRQWRIAGAYLLCGIIGLMLSFGPHAPTHGSTRSLFEILVMLPGASGLRAAGRFGVLVLLVVSVFAGYGVAAMERRFASATRIACAILVPLMLCEWFVVQFPLAVPERAELPAIYDRLEIRTAKAYVSLPDYTAEPSWYDGGDYLLFSTTNWTPIVNGYGRAMPPDYSHLISHMKAFPGPNNARFMRELGVDYLVLRAGSYPDHAVDILRDARESPEYDLVAQVGSDYLFRVRPAAR